jgi:hypothetical protein
VTCFTGWENPNADELMLDGHSDLIEAFALIVDPDDNPLDGEPFSQSLFEYPDASMPWLEEKTT